MALRRFDHTNPRHCRRTTGRRWAAALRFASPALVVAAAGCATPRGVEPAAIDEDRLAEVLTLEECGEGTDRLAFLASDEDALVRRTALLALGRIDVSAEASTNVPAVLSAALVDEAAAVRAAAALAIALRADAGEVLAEEERVAREYALERALTDGDQLVRARAVDAAAACGGERGRDATLFALNDPSPLVRRAAAVAPLRWPGDAADAGLVDERLVRFAVEDERLQQAFAGRGNAEDLAVARALCATLARRAAMPAAELFAQLAAGPNAARDGEVRLFAVSGLAALLRRSDPADPRRRAWGAALAAGARDVDWRVAVEAAQGAPPEDHGIELLAELAAHSTHHVRRAAFARLAALDPRQLSPEAQALAAATLLPEREESAAVRGERLIARARHAGAAAVSEIDAALADRSVQVRVAAVAALAGLPSDLALARLERATGDVPRVAGRALESMGAHAGDERARGLLRKHVLSEDLGLRLAAINALALDPQAADVAALALAYERSAGNGLASEVRFHALRTASAAAGVEEETERISALVSSALSDESPFVRRIARDVAHVRGLPADAAASPAAPFDAREAADLLRRGTRPRVEILTEKGALVFELLADETPRHVLRFLELVESGHYSDLTWHRVVPDFVVQGGDARGDGNGAFLPGGRVLRREFTAAAYLRGSLGMPRNEDPDSGGSQLFITHRDTPHLERRYTLFGRLLEGQEALDRLEEGDRLLSARRLPEDANL